MKFVQYAAARHPTEAEVEALSRAHDEAPRRHPVAQA